MPPRLLPAPQTLITRGSLRRHCHWARHRGCSLQRLQSPGIGFSLMYSSQPAGGSVMGTHRQAGWLHRCETCHNCVNKHTCVPPCFLLTGSDISQNFKQKTKIEAQKHTLDSKKFKYYICHIVTLDGSEMVWQKPTKYKVKKI